jgi:hypothetical protein
MIPHLLGMFEMLNPYAVLWSACMATGIFLLLPRRQ